MDKVTVAIPASPQYVQVIRLIAAGLASRLGFTLDEIDDLKIAVDELAAYLTGTQGRDGTLDIVFRVEGEQIEITGTGRFSTEGTTRTELTEFSRMILETVADRASLSDDGGPHFELVKSRTS